MTNQDYGAEETTDALRTDRDHYAREAQHFRSIFENMEEAYLETDLRGNFVFFNNSMCRMLGYARGELDGKNYRLISPPGHASKIFRMFNEVYRTGQNKTFLYHELLAKDGSIVYVEMSVCLIRAEGGKPSGFSCLSRNVTERQKVRRAIEENEKRLRILSDNMRDIIWTMDFDFHYTYLSPSVYRITGYTPEEIMSIPLSELLPKDNYEIAAQTLLRGLDLEARGQRSDPDKKSTFEFEQRRKDGSTLWLEVSSVFNRDEDGKPTEIIGMARDISERKQAEAQILESEIRYRTIVENMYESIAIMDLNFQIVYQSPSEIRVTGFTPEEMKTMPLEQMLTPESLKQANSAVRQMLEAEFNGMVANPQRSVTLELEGYKKGGGTLWEEVNATFQRDGKGAPIGIIWSSRDITSRKRAQDALQESEKRYRMIVENMNDVIWTVDRNLNRTYTSPSSTRITGYTPEETLSLPLDHALTPESYAYATGRLAEEMALEESGKPFDPNRAVTIEIELIHKDGRTLWMEVTGTFNRDAQGKITDVLVVGRDITERKSIEKALVQSENRYKMIIENIHEVIWTTDLNLQYTYVSPSCQWLTGFTPEEIMAMPIDQLLTPESFELAQNAFGAELALQFSGQPVDRYRSRTIEQGLRHKNGSTLWMEVTATFTHDEEGKTTGVLLAGRDITERKMADEEKSRLQAQLNQAQKMETVGRLAGGVAHDFNNMLSVILGYADLAKLRLARQHPVLKDIAEIEKAAVRSRDITAQLLAFSRKQVIEPRVLDLNDLVAHTQKALVRLIGEDIELRFQRDNFLWPILFDPSQIEQILINLAVNARDAMPEGGKLIIETRNAPIDAQFCKKHMGFKPGQYVCLSVSDTGTGIDEETLQHIFEPFFTTKEEGKGTGLGLATVYGIVKQNNGYIDVDSHLGAGTTFFIYLPRTEVKRHTAQGAQEKPAFIGKGNILLVEDDAMVLQIASGILESFGYTVIVAQNPMDAIALCENPETIIDLVITDVVMPKMSGKDLKDRLTQIRPDINVLYMSGYTADIIAHHGILEEGVQFLQKPFTIESMAQKLREVLPDKQG